MDIETVRLTSLSHGGGCGCKIAPAALAQILDQLPEAFREPALLIGSESSDDAAVYRLNDGQAVVVTTDFFMPIVDDPHDFGRIAATNALSDVYAMGGRPIFALAVVGMPLDKLPLSTIKAILAGGADACGARGVPIAGGHSIDAPEPIYGLVAVGLVDPAKVKRNDTAQPGDCLILGKPLGVGILSSALKNGSLDAQGYAAMIDVTTQLNDIGTALAEVNDVHAMTDVTGFGILGHLVEMCSGSNLRATLALNSLPLIPQAETMARGGVSTGAAARNWASYGHNVALPGDMPAWQKALLCDPQTSGGLLVSCAADAAQDILALFHERDYAAARIVGRMVDGEPGVTVRATSD